MWAVFCEGEPWGRGEKVTSLSLRLRVTAAPGDAAQGAHRAGTPNTGGAGWALPQMSGVQGGLRVRVAVREPGGGCQGQESHATPSVPGIPFPSHSPTLWARRRAQNSRRAVGAPAWRRAPRSLPRPLPSRTCIHLAGRCREPCPGPAGTPGPSGLKKPPPICSPTTDSRFP